MAKRGQLTDKIKAISKKSLGYEINQTQLRLMPYIQYTLVDTQKIDRRKIDEEETQILLEWEREGRIMINDTIITTTKDFWNAICEILYYGYVAYENEQYISDTWNYNPPK